MSQNKIQKVSYFVKQMLTLIGVLISNSLSKYLILFNDFFSRFLNNTGMCCLSFHTKIHSKPRHKKKYFAKIVYCQPTLNLLKYFYGLKKIK